MNITNLRDQLARDEGKKLKPYPDTRGKLTIGIGRNLTDNGISEAEANMLFESDLREHTRDVLERLPWAEFLDEPRRAVLINMCFNMGIVNLLGFKQMLTAMERKDWKTASEQPMLISAWAYGRLTR